MNVNFSIDGVLRNTIAKLDYHYKDYFLESETETEEDFNYNIIYPIQNDNLSKHFNFQSSEEFLNFLFIEYPLEIFGHAPTSYPNVFGDLNKLIYDNKDCKISVVGLDELGKAKPATLFFLSKNGFMGNKVKFISSCDIKNEWKSCDLWITDSKKVIELCPRNKTVIKFNTIYNEHILNKHQINDLKQIDTKWLKFSENTTTLMSILSPNLVKQVKKFKMIAGMIRLK